MRVEAILSRDDVAHALAGFVPLELELGDVGTGERMLTLDELGEVTLAPDIGIRLVCAGHLRWPVLGVEVPVRIPRIHLLIQPSVQSRDGHDHLVFRLSLEDAEIAWIPAALERGIMEKVNKELIQHHIEAAWDFTDTLSHVFALPDALRSAEAIGLEAVAGRVSVTAAALGLSVAFRANVRRRAPRGA